MIIKNVDIITPHGVLKGHKVLIENELIADISLDEFTVHGNHKVIDGEGNYLSPGFIDIHNHGNSGFDIMDSTEQALDCIGKYHLLNGVTSYLATVITSSKINMINAIDNISNYRRDRLSSKLLGVHLEGPFLNASKKGAQSEKYIQAPDISFMKSLLNSSNGKIKMVSLAPELDGALDMIKYLKSNHIVVAMGHTNANYEEAKLGISYGANLATHLYNGMRNFDHREPGIIGAVLNDDRVYCELIYDRVHVHDEAIKIALSMKGYDKIVLVSDAIRATGLGDGEYELGGQLVYVSNGIARLKSGNLAGSTINLRRAVYNMINFLNIPIYKAVKMASLNPASLLGLHHTLGSIEIGKKADLIIFDKDINIKNIILDGQAYSV